MRRKRRRKYLPEENNFTAPGLNLFQNAAGTDINQFAYKLLFLDVGLMNHVTGVRWSDLSRLDDVKLVNEGAVAEQFIGQHLAYLSQGIHPPEPVYWLREGRNTNAEVDYVVSSGPNIFPVEIKAGRSGSLRSLQQFAASGKSLTAVRFDTNPPSRQKVTHQVPVAGKNKKTTFLLLSLPLYAVGELQRLLDQEPGAPNFTFLTTG